MKLKKSSLASTRGFSLASIYLLPNTKFKKKKIESDLVIFIPVHSVT